MAIWMMASGLFVHFRALSSYYSGSWNGTSLRVYVGRTLGHIERCVCGGVVVVSVCSLCVRVRARASALFCVVFVCK